MADTTAADLTVSHGIKVTAKWDWTTSNSTGRWTTPQQGIKPRRVFVPTDPNDPYNDGFGVLKSRLLIRGKGESLVIRFQSEDGKDFQILGWSIPFKGKKEDA